MEETMNRFCFILAFIISIAADVVAQDSLCGTHSGSGSYPQKLSESRIDLDAVEMVDIALAIHIVTDSNGEGGINPSAGSTIASQLTSWFSGAMMRFFVLTIDSVRNDHFYSPGPQNESEDDDLSEINVVANAINMYLLPNYRHGGTGTFASHETGNRTTQSVIIKNANVGSTTVPHEVGHYLTYCTHSTM